MISTYEDKADTVKNKSQKRSFKPPKKISERYLYNSGLAYLQRFPASSMHFRTIMMRKINKSCRHHTDQNLKMCEKLLDELILEFQDLGLLDDTAYLNGMIVSLRRRGLSSAQIRLKLQQKGYKQDHILSALKKHDSDEYNSSDNGDVYAALTFARKKRLGPYDIEQKKTPEKSLAMMARAGYSYDIAKKTLALTTEELEEKLTRLSTL